MRRRLFHGIGACALSASLCLAMAGCTFSETITQTIYDQDEKNEVDDTQTLLVNTLNAKRKTDQLPKLVTDDRQKEKQDTTENLPSYGGDTSKALVAKPRESKKKNEQKAEPEQTDTAGEQQSKGTGSNSSAEEGRGDGSSRGTETDDEDGRGDAKGKDGKNPKESGGTQESGAAKGKNADNEVKVYEDYGDLPEIPKGVKHVTAVGQAAVIVSMLGGTSKKTPLVGADEELLENKGAQKVLANKGIASVKKVWKDDGTSEGDLDDVDDIVKLDPELCFVTEGEKTLTDKQEKALLKKNIIVYVLPNMKSASKISYAVELVGKILKAGGNDGAGELASDYVKWHDDLVDKLKDKNKGLTGGFNFDKGKKASSDATPLSTLYVSDWDYDAVYDDPNDYLESSQGVGIADLGYEEAPVTYYMSVGGVLNNAAAGTFRDLSGYAAPVWQFSLTKAPSAWGNWKSIDRGKASYALKGNGFDNALLWSNSESAGLGTRAFPGVVVANQKMARAMERDAGDDHGLYYPYPTAKSTHGGVITTSTVGFYTGSNLVDACIGTSGGHTRSVLNDGSDVEAYDIHVNPSGPFSSWTEGSVESVLEASWVQKTFRDSSYDLNADIEGFYSKFYDYSLASSEVDEILAGEES